MYLKTDMRGNPFQPRYDEQRGIYRDCRFCQGQGCLSCPAEAEKAYKAEFPNGPQPIATFKIGNDPGALDDLLKRLIGPVALADAHTTARHRADELMENGTGGVVRQLLAGPFGDAPTPEKTRDLLAGAMVTGVLTENIVATAKQFSLEQGDLFAESVKPAGKRRRKATPKAPKSTDN